MRAVMALGAAAMLLCGCASSDPDTLSCGWVSGYQEPPEAERLYAAVVTHINGKPVISRPNYQLLPGDYEFTLMPLIDAADLKVTPRAYQAKRLNIKVAVNTRYHFAARYKDDKVYVGDDADFWEPLIWQVEQAECSFEAK